MLKPNYSPPLLKQQCVIPKLRINDFITQKRRDQVFSPRIKREVLNSDLGDGKNLAFKVKEDHLVSGEKRSLKFKLSPPSMRYKCIANKFTSSQIEKDKNKQKEKNGFH